MPKKLTDLIITNVDLVGKGANPDAHIVLFKSEEAPNSQVIEKEVNAMTLQELLAKLTPEEKGLVDAELTTKDAELTAKAEELKKAQEELETIKKAAEPKPAAEDIFKDASPEVKAAVETFKKQAEEATAKAAEEAARAEKAETEIKKSEFVAKATELKSIPTVDAEKLGVLLMKASSSFDKEQYDTLFGILKSANELIQTGKTFSVEGSDAGGEGKDAKTEIEAKAKELAKQKDITYEQAYVDVVKAEPELYERYKDEQKGVE